MGSEANDVKRLFDALDELRLLLEESIPARQHTKLGRLFAQCIGAGLLKGCLRSAERLRERTMLLWRGYRNRYKRKRNTFLLLIVSGAIRPANVELSCSGPRTCAGNL